jgi:hypothetical protein
MHTGAAAPASAALTADAFAAALVVTQTTCAGIASFTPPAVSVAAFTPPAVSSWLSFTARSPKARWSTNPVQHQRTKHVEIDLHFISDRVAIGDVRVLHVPTTSQFADIFTKGLPSSTFSEFRSRINVASG